MLFSEICGALSGYLPASVQLAVHFPETFLLPYSRQYTFRKPSCFRTVSACLAPRLHLVSYTLNILHTITYIPSPLYLNCYDKMLLVSQLCCSPCILLAFYDKNVLLIFKNILQGFTGIDQPYEKPTNPEVGKIIIL